MIVLYCVLTVEGLPLKSRKGFCWGQKNGSYLAKSYNREVLPAILWMPQQSEGLWHEVMIPMKKCAAVWFLLALGLKHWSPLGSFSQMANLSRLSDPSAACLADRLGPSISCCRRWTEGLFATEFGACG